MKHGHFTHIEYLARNLESLTFDDKYYLFNFQCKKCIHFTRIHFQNSMFNFVFSSDNFIEQKILFKGKIPFSDQQLLVSLIMT